MPFVGLAADDLVPCTANWDTALVKKLAGWNFVTANDERQVQPDIGRSRMHGATVFSGPLLRAVGGLFPEGLRHIFHDDYWETIGRETGAWQIAMEVVTRHDHDFYLTGQRDATMDPSSDLWQHDQKWFENWRAFEKDVVIGRVKKMMADHGVKVIDPDLTGVRLMIATPCHSGRLQRLALEDDVDAERQGLLGDRHGGELHRRHQPRAVEPLLGLLPLERDPHALHR
jgi:hypothetical protein